jgi:hypothetical protein
MSNFPNRMAASFCLVLLTLLPRATPAPDPIVARFDEPKRPNNWTVNFGHWEPKDGVLVCRQLDKDNHAAASRWQIPLKDASIKLRLKFDGATAFHLGFDPAPGELKKQGHLYSLVITPTQAQLKKHRDKADEASKDQTMATASLNASEWLDVELRTEGEKVSATIGKTVKLEASDPSFSVAKPTVVFRVIGGDVQLDDVQVTVLKAAEIKPAEKKAATKNSTGDPHVEPNHSSKLRQN